MKGVILAGGKGTRLRPATYAMNKHMVPILNKPMILYPLETLRSLGCKDILIVSGGNHIGQFADFLGDGGDYGVNLTYRVQKEAGGIAEALGLAESFAGKERIAVILGDNIFDDISEVDIMERSGAVIFTKEVEFPNRFGVYSPSGKIIIEKPEMYVTPYAVTGLYIYPPEVFKIIKTLSVSDRGELEITDVNNHFLKIGECDVRFLGPSKFWSDAGTPESLAEVTKWAAEKLKFNEN